MHWLLFLTFGIVSFFAVLIPIPGSIVLNPIMVNFYEPHNAIGVALFYFFLNSCIKAFMFREYIVLSQIKVMLPPALILAPIGALVIGYLPAKALLILMLFFAIYFVYNKVQSLCGRKNIKKTTDKSSYTVAVITGFMQGTGLGGGGSLRKLYFLSQNLDLKQLNGTSSTIAIFTLLASVLTRLFTNQVRLDQLTPVLWVIPILLIANYLGRDVLKKLHSKVLDIIIIITMIIITVLLITKIF